MSRVAKRVIDLPAGVTVSQAGNVVTVKGAKGSLNLPLTNGVSVEQADKKVTVRFQDGEGDRIRAGSTRAHLNNMINGVTKGYEKKLEVVGVGYLAAIQKNTLQLRVGFANEIHKPIPAGLTVTCPDQTHIVIKGTDKQLVGQFAAEVRSVRKPEPYKGKGIRYDGEVVRRKAGKAMTK